MCDGNASLLRNVGEVTRSASIHTRAISAGSRIGICVFCQSRSGNGPCIYLYCSPLVTLILSLICNLLLFQNFLCQSLSIFDCVFRMAVSSFQSGLISLDMRVS